MSEALSSSEIEDVLSSIRRLVSDDMRPIQRATGAGSDPSGAGADGEKLMLTPALRVVQSEGSSSAPTAIDAVVSSVGAGMDRQGDDWESETGDLAPERPTDAAFESDAAPMAEDVAEGSWSDLRIDAYAEAIPLRQTPQAPEIAEADDAESPHEFTTIRTVDADAEILVDSTPPKADAPADDFPGWVQGAVDHDDRSDVDDATDEPTDDLSPDPWSGATIEPDRAWADQAEAAVLQELSGALPPLNSDEFVMNETEGPDEFEVPVDEAMLREIVRDVLREELQGRLGERITRNIRKLVRAEIARVMAEEDLL